MVRVTVLFALVTFLFVTWLLDQIRKAEPWDRTVYWILATPWFVLILIVWLFWRGSVLR